MKQLRILALALAFIATPALAQVTPGTSPLTGPKGGTNNAFMQFTGPAGSLKTFTLPNAADTIATLAAVRTWTGAQSFTDGTLILLGLTSGSTTLKAPATGGGNATVFTGTDTFVGRATTDVLTNKTFVCANQTSCIVRLGSDVTGQLPIANGGTGQATNTLGFNALAPTPTRAGDITYWNGSNYVNLPGNNSGTLTLQENASGVPVWASVAGTGTVTSITCGATTITTSGTCPTIAVVKVQKFTASGTYTPSTGLQYAVIECVGSGGGGGGATSGGTLATGGGGGGAGGYSRAVATAAAIGGSQAVTVPSGGTGGAAGGAGGAGGDVSLGALCIGKGGSGGSGSTGPGTGNGGAGGVAGTGTVTAPGMAGFTGISSNASSTSLGVAGAGGSTLFGAGGASLTSGSSVAGNGGTGNGAGGGGGVSTTTNGGAGGGAGTVGIVIVTEYTNQ